MKVRSLFLKLAIFSFIIIFAFSNNVFGKSFKNKNINQVTMDNLKKISGGSDLKVTSSEGNNNYGVNIDVNSKNQKKGYYTSCVYKNVYDNWLGYEGVKFDVMNKSKGELNLSFVLNQRNGKNAILSDNKVVIIKNENSNLLERIHPNYGNLKIPENFKGTVYIPFKSLIEKNNKDNNCSISEVLSWGISVTLAQNEEKSFMLSNFLLMSRENGIEEASEANFNIAGDSEVQVPVLGESIALYNVKDNNLKNIKFELKDFENGIKINTDGRLIVLPCAKPHNIKICAIENNKLSESKEIRIFKSWTLSVKEVDGTRKSIPQPNAVPNLLNSKYKILLSTKVLNIIRIVLITMVIILGLAFLYWRKVYSK